MLTNKKLEQGPAKHYRKRWIKPQWAPTGCLEEHTMPTLTRPRNQPNRSREIIGHYIKERRLTLGLTQQELLNKLGSDMWATAWSQVETGTRNLPPALWDPVAKALDIPVKEFASVMLRYTNPWAYGMIYGYSPALRAELDAIPDRYSE